MSITVFTADRCVQCNATKRALDKAGLDYTTVDVDSVEGMRDTLADKYNAMALPVVVVTDDEGATTDHWSGYRHESIKALSA